MLLWLMIGMALAILGIVELLLNFTIPFTELRTVLIFLLVLGMSYRLYLMERGGEKETLNRRILELEEKCRELETGKNGD